jgi:hypothetical protein
MQQRIKSVLAEIEAKENVIVLYACESGSRSWGFASIDSDYDVRFLYLHEPSWYLSVDFEVKRDVIELPIVDELDVKGWDFRKALKLFRKSNVSLNEWLGSPIVYREERQTASKLRVLQGKYYSPTACSYHYLNLAKNNCHKYLKGDKIWRKKYFYMIRPLLAVRWIQAGKGVVPTEFNKLLESMVPTGSLREAIDNLIVQKSSGAEHDRGPGIPIINDFILEEIERLEQLKFNDSSGDIDVEPLNQLFRQELCEVFGDTYMTAD